MHRPDDRDVIDDLADVGQQVADRLAALAALVELVRGAQQLGMPLDEREPLVLEQLVGAGLHVVLDQGRLVVEQVLLGRGARHVEIDDPLGLGREVRRPGDHRVVGRGRQRPGPSWSAGPLRSSTLAAHEHRQGDRAQPGLGMLEELAARHGAGSLQVQIEIQFRVHAISPWSRRRRGSAARWRSWSRRPGRRGPCPGEAARAARSPGRRPPRDSGRIAPSLPRTA